MKYNSYIKILEGFRNFVKVTSALSYESIHRIQNPKPFENGYEGLTEFIRFGIKYPWI